MQKHPWKDKQIIFEGKECGGPPATGVFGPLGREGANCKLNGKKGGGRGQKRQMRDARRITWKESKGGEKRAWGGLVANIKMEGSRTFCMGGA